VSKQLVFGPEYVPTMFFQPETTIRLEPLLTSTVLGIPWMYALWILFQSKSGWPSSLLLREKNDHATT
jgi:hypothetical protein